MTTPIPILLNNWCVVYGGHLHLTGNAIDHPDLGNSPCRTSPISVFTQPLKEGDLIHTLGDLSYNGNLYQLGTPLAGDWQEWCIANKMKWLILACEPYTIEPHNHAITEVPDNEA